jgi:hypothetical protein
MCKLTRRGFKPKNPPAHTCEKNYEPPEKLVILGKTYVKIFVVHKLFETSKATKYKIRCIPKQFVNGYRVTGKNNELFIPNHLFYTQRLSEPFIWVEESHYNKMVFI